MRVARRKGPPAGMGARLLFKKYGQAVISVHLGVHKRAIFLNPGEDSARP